MKDKPTTAPRAEFPANGNYGTVSRFARAAKGFGISPADTNLLLDSLPEHVLGSMYAAERGSPGPWATARPRGASGGEAARPPRGELYLAITRTISRHLLE